MIRIGYVDLERLILMGWRDTNAQLGWQQWNKYAASGEWF